VSATTIWKTAIKSVLDKLRTDGGAARRAECLGMLIIWVHAKAARALPFQLADRFDRLPIAQAQVEGLTFVTASRRFLA
jgi:PIN domain nuclease of toxin-antitoxin system